MTSESASMDDTQNKCICDMCYQMFDSEDLLEIHRQLCRNEKEMSQSLERVDNEEKPHKCETCSLAFDSGNLYEKHKLACTT